MNEYFWKPTLDQGASQVTVVKNPPANAGDSRDSGLTPGSGRFSWSRQYWQPTPVFVPGKFHGHRSLVGYSPSGCKQSDMTERLSTHILYQTLYQDLNIQKFSHVFGTRFLKN